MHGGVPQWRGPVSQETGGLKRIASIVIDKQIWYGDLRRIYNILASAPPERCKSECSRCGLLGALVLSICSKTSWTWLPRLVAVPVASERKIQRPCNTVCRECGSMSGVVHHCQ